MPRCWQASSDCALNSEPPSNWIALFGKGVHSKREWRRRIVVWAVVR